MALSVCGTVIWGWGAYLGPNMIPQVNRELRGGEAEHRDDRSRRFSLLAAHASEGLLTGPTAGVQPSLSAGPSSPNWVIPGLANPYTPYAGKVPLLSTLLFLP